MKENKKSKEEKKTIKNKPKKIEVAKRIAHFSLVEVIIIVVVVSFAVSIISGFVVFKNYNFISSQTSNDNRHEELSELIKVYDELKTKYVEDIQSSDLIKAAIDGMLNYLDIYTDYLDEETTLDLQDRLNGEYRGIGVEISVTTDGDMLIANVFENTPAFAAGLQKGDIITAINGQSVIGKKASEVANEIKNAANSEISLTYKRNSKESTVKINLSNVIIPSVEYEVLEGDIGYLKLTTFSSTTYSQSKEALAKLNEKNVKSLIVDVRNNTGGYLSSAKSVSDLFLDKGKVIYQLKYRDETVSKYTSKTSDKTTYPISVLINEGSASAAEILAAALKESYGATLVGTKSFGKGTVQETEVLTNGSMIKYTSAYWLTPNGNNINGIGLEPDVLVKNSEDKDLQLEKAIQTLK